MRRIVLPAAPIKSLTRQQGVSARLRPTDETIANAGLNAAASTSRRIFGIIVDGERHCATRVLGETADGCKVLPSVIHLQRQRRYLQRRFGRVAEETMQRRHHLSALADGAADPLDRTRTHVADREHAGHRGLQGRRQLP